MSISAVITSLPEKISKKCTRMGVSYKIGDVTIIVDMLTKASKENDTENSRTVGTVDYVRNVTGKMLLRTIHISDLVLPSDIRELRRNQVIASELLGPEKRIDGLNVYRLLMSDIGLLREREGEIFCNMES